MNNDKKIVLDTLRNAEKVPEVAGQDIMALERFAEDTRHMIIFDVLTWECPVGDKGQRVRIFLTDEGYQNTLGYKCIKKLSNGETFIYSGTASPL